MEGEWRNGELRRIKGGKVMSISRWLVLVARAGNLRVSNNAEDVKFGERLLEMMASIEREVPSKNVEEGNIERMSLWKKSSGPHLAE